MSGTYLDYVGTGQPVPGGHFRLGLATGATTIIAGGSAILCLRWIDQAHYFVLLDVTIEAVVSTAMGAAQLMDAALFINRSWSTAPSGGTSVMPMTQPATGKLRDQGGSMAVTLLNASALQIATTGALTTGTRVQDTYPIGYVMFNIGANTAGISDTRSLYSLNYANDHPVVLGVNQGIEITLPTTQGATGVTKYYVNLRWAEVPNF